MDTLERKLEKLNELIIVPCHGVYIGTQAGQAEQEQCWVSAFPDEGRWYVEHIKAGVALAAERENSLLLFSGGQTKQKAGPLSEAQSYWFLARQLGWFGSQGVQERSTTEEFARDSLENLDFSVKRFAQMTGKYPAKITVCCWGFKQERYKFHAEALGLAAAEFQYLAVNEPPGRLEDSTTTYAQSWSGEKKVLEMFRCCPRGDKGVLLEKRLSRDPFKRGEPYGDKTAGNKKAEQTVLSEQQKPYYYPEGMFRRPYRTIHAVLLAKNELEKLGEHIGKKVDVMTRNVSFEFLTGISPEGLDGVYWKDGHVFDGQEIQLQWKEASPHSRGIYSAYGSLSEYPPMVLLGVDDYQLVLGTGVAKFPVRIIPFLSSYHGGKGDILGGQESFHYEAVRHITLHQPHPYSGENIFWRNEKDYTAHLPEDIQHKIKQYCYRESTVPED